MVGSLLLIKMLHCRRMQQNIRSSITEESVVNNTPFGTRTEEASIQEAPSFNEIKVKKENDNNICRVCLKEGNIPIYGNEVYDDVSEALISISGIEITTDDSYPKFLCSSCNDVLQSAILLRETAQKSDEILKQPAELPEINDHFDVPIEYLDDDSCINKVFQRKKRKVRRKKQQSYNCKKCKESFKTFDEYNEHKMSPEHENKKVACPVCNKFYTTLYLRRHLALHKDEAPFMCDICGKNFTMQGPFTRHRLTHFYKLPYQCSLCPYKGRFSESLKMHMRSHTGERPYPCTECPKKFINKSNLNKHMLTHKGEHDFKCDTCGKGFYVRRELEQHFKVDHTGLKDHICNICGKEFGYRKQMMKHQLKVHKREKLRSGKMPLYLKVETLKRQGHDIES